MLSRPMHSSSITAATAEQFRGRFELLCAELNIRAAELRVRLPQQRGFDFDITSSRPTQTLLLPAACMIKPMTALLVARLVQQGRLAYDQQVAPLLPQQHAGWRLCQDLLKDVTIAQLLSHQHGLGNMALGQAPFTAAGLIEADGVFRHIASEGRLFPAGRFYGYGNTGYILLGMLIEHIEGRPFSTVLEQHVLRPMLGSAYREHCRGTDSAICPASASGLMISSKCLTQLASIFLLNESNLPWLDAACISLLLTPAKPVPGLSMFVKGACLGWKDFGKGWRGHNGFSAGAAAVLRFHPASACWFVLLACASQQGRALPLLIAQCTRAFFPELFDPGKGPVPAAVSSDTTANGLVGRFGSPQRVYTIKREVTGFELEISERNEQGLLEKRHGCLLYPAADEVFYLTRPWNSVPFVQLLRCPDSGELGLWLWDHENVWPRLAAASSGEQDDVAN